MALLLAWLMAQPAPPVSLARGTFLSGTPRRPMAIQLRTTCYPYSMGFREGWMRWSTQHPGNCSVLWSWKKLMKMEKRQRERLKHPTVGDLQLGRPGICSCSDDLSRGPSESPQAVTTEPSHASLAMLFVFEHTHALTCAHTHIHMCLMRKHMQAAGTVTHVSPCKESREESLHLMTNQNDNR